jgi:UDP-3-O-[3-hydroxymyristoyl] glucosamine N-acyltransferase
VLTPKHLVSPQAAIGSTVYLAAGVRVGPYAVIGAAGGIATRIGEDTEIASHALIEDGATIGNRCVIDAYCRICSGATIGDDTRILYGAAIYEDASIGKKCIVGGNVADRTVLEDFVTFFGEIAHDYRIARDLSAWDEATPPSPVIRTRSVVGQNALLVGGIEIGQSSYIAAGEIVRCNVPADHVFLHGRLRPMAQFKGLIQARTDE